ncbi:hypothetical protein AB6A40_003206 [Gnathostoma spinigerum]|uniref:Uncharacterized protein n=1 Tax=Gnathostoma spinigerum TaxID=75299 RepID=A0ABD6EB57_9BILA
MLNAEDQPSTSTSVLCEQQKANHHSETDVRPRKTSERPAIPKKPICKEFRSSRPPLAPKPKNWDAVRSHLSSPSLSESHVSNFGGRALLGDSSDDSHSCRSSQTPKFPALSVEFSNRGIRNLVKETAAFFDDLILSGRVALQGTSANDFVRDDAYSSATAASKMTSSAGVTSCNDLRDGGSTFYDNGDCGVLQSPSCDIVDARTMNDVSIHVLSRTTSLSELALGSREIDSSDNNNMHSLTHREMKYMARGNRLRNSNLEQSGTSDDISSGIGKTCSRPTKKMRGITSDLVNDATDDGSIRWTEVHNHSDFVSQESDRLKRGSVISDISTECSYRENSQPFEVVYDTGDEDENKRLRNLHFAALEVFTTEKSFVQQLEALSVKYPKYLAEYGSARNIDVLSVQSNGQTHVVHQITVQLSMIKEAHKVLLEKFASKLADWDSRHPNLAGCLKNNAAFLKYCLPYLKEKCRFASELSKELKENEALAAATAMFEEEVLNKISVVQRLDIVHQNVVRYCILMEAYKKYLLPNTYEYNECVEAIVELSKVTELVNHRVSLAEMEKRLFDLYRRFEGKFNVFEANRHLLHEGELLKQSRKEVQTRYLILFSDVLLICKYSRTPTLGAENSFHPDFYQFQLSDIEVKAEEHGEFETHFQLLSTKKSAVFIAKTKRERDEWVERLSSAKKEARELDRIRQGGHEKKVTRLQSHVVRKKNRIMEVVDRDQTPDRNDGSLSDDLAATVNANENYVAPWIPDPKATTCMMSGCTTKFSVVNRRHHCRHCGCIICRSCVAYAPVRNGPNYVREKVCPECFDCIWRKRDDFMNPDFFTPPSGGHRAKVRLPGRIEGGIVSGTVFLRNKRLGESEKWGRLMCHDDGAMILCFYNAEFDIQPCARHVLIGFNIKVVELDEGGRLFELYHCNQFRGHDISIVFRIPHSGIADRWKKALEEGLGPCQPSTE